MGDEEERPHEEGAAVGVSGGVDLHGLPSLACHCKVKGKCHGSSDHLRAVAWK